MFKLSLIDEKSKDSKMLDGILYILKESMYRTRAIITRGLYTFYPIFKGQKRFFKELFL